MPRTPKRALYSARAARSPNLNASIAPFAFRISHFEFRISNFEFA
jgi:hypothetical protein